MPTIHIDEGGLQPLGPSVFGQGAKVAILTELVDDDRYLNGATVELFTNDIVPSALTSADDFDLPEWTGYTPKNVVWGTPANEGSGGATVEATSVNWLSGSNADTLVYGWFVRAGTDQLVYARRLTTPIPVVGVQSITVVPAIYWS